MNLQELNFEEDKVIDLHNLEHEWNRQADLVFNYSHALAEARRNRDAAKDSLKVVEAEVQLEVRTEPEEWGLRKGPNNDEVRSTVDCSDRVQDAKKALRDAQFEYDLTEGAYNAIRDRKWALQDEVSLHLNKYYGEPSERKVNAPSEETSSGGFQRKRVVDQMKRHSKQAKGE